MNTNNYFNYPGETPDKENKAYLFLENISSEEWEELLDYTTSQEFKSNDIVIEKGNEDGCLIFIESGELEVLIPFGKAKHLERLTTISAGSIVGEQSFIDHGPRSTSIRAISSGRLYQLSRESFKSLAEKNSPLALKVSLDLGMILSKRLRDTTQFLSANER